MDCVCCNGTVTVLQLNCGKNFCQDTGDFLKELWYTKIKICRKTGKMQRQKHTAKGGIRMEEKAYLAIDLNNAEL